MDETKDKVRFLHHWTPQAVDEFCSEHEHQGEKVMLRIESYKKERICQRDDEDGSLTEYEEDTITGGIGYQIHSSKDIFQLDNDDVKRLNEDIKEELR